LLLLEEPTDDERLSEDVLLLILAALTDDERLSEDALLLGAGG